MKPEILFSQTEIASRLEELAGRIAATPDPPEVAAPILAGAFVFAADLLRALSSRGLSLPVEFLWLQSYGAGRNPSQRIVVLAGPGEAVRDRHVLVVDGVLDHGHTLESAIRMTREAGARRVTSIVAVDKRRIDARLSADYALFADVKQFVVGYGMDDAGYGRGLPYIGAAE